MNTEVSKKKDETKSYVAATFLLIIAMTSFILGVYLLIQTTEVIDYTIISGFKVPTENP